MDNMDFKGALDDFNITVDFIEDIGTIASLNKNDFFPKNEHIELIRTALRIADRLQSGGVSHKMEIKALELPRDEFGTHPWPDDVFKAMAGQLIEECKNN
tara:strand:+ start:198 stop:497 length:300 start_codon:yes stop_codon:yes gene_type:complete